MSAKFEVIDVESGGAYVRLVGGNGEIMFHTEVYDSRSNAERAILDITGAVFAAVEAKFSGKAET